MISHLIQTPYFNSNDGIRMLYLKEFMTLMQQLFLESMKIISQPHVLFWYGESTRKDSCSSLTTKVIKPLHFKTAPNVSLTFGWLPLERQVRILGTIEMASAKESDEYFASRPRGHQIGAWSSPQSRTIGDRSILAEQYEQYENKFADIEVPRPSHWGGYRVRPSSIEFWQGQRDRLHDRFRFTKSKKIWSVERLAP